MDENMALFMDKLKKLIPFAKEKEQELTPDMIIWRQTAFL